jgi:hypothetical protein
MENKTKSLKETIVKILKRLTISKLIVEAIKIKYTLFFRYLND